MPIFKLSAPETVRLLSGHILPRSASNFTHIHLDFKKIVQGETPDPCLQGREGKGKVGRDWSVCAFKGSAEEKDRGREGYGKGGEGPAAGRILLQDPRGIDAPGRNAQQISA